MRAGRMDRYITIEEPTTILDTFGGDHTTWSEFAKCWAQRADVKARERFNADQIMAEEVATFRIRWREGIKPTFRILSENKIYLIVGLAELGRRAGLEITAIAQDVSNA